MIKYLQRRINLNENKQENPFPVIKLLGGILSIINNNKLIYTRYVHSHDIYPDYEYLISGYVASIIHSKKLMESF